MDERLQKALDFSNYTNTIKNQKKNIKNRVAQIQLVYSDGGTFIADHTTISFLKTLVDMKHKNAVILDSKENPIKVISTEKLLEKLLSAYFSATNEYTLENDKITKARNIKQIMDW